MNLLLAPISVVGCGKSTIFRTLSILFPTFQQVENDSCNGAKHFYAQIEQASKTKWAVLVDKNNHLRKHRSELIRRFKKPGVVTVALLFVPIGMSKEELFALAMERIRQRGDNHKTVKSSSNYRQSRMVLNRFLKEYEPYDESDEHEGTFDYILPLELGPESSLANVKRIIAFADEVSHGALTAQGLPLDEMVERAYLQSLNYKVVQDKTQTSGRSRRPARKADKSHVNRPGTRLGTKDNAARERPVIISDTTSAQESAREHWKNFKAQ